MTHPELSSLIYLLRGRRVMLSPDLARLYGVPTKVLVQAVKRNRTNFPDDFLFEVSKEEFSILRSQFVTSSWGGARWTPFAFTEHGVAMLSSVLRSPRAISVNILIIRAFVKMRELASQNREILAKLDQLERRVGRSEADISAIIDAIRREAAGDDEPRRRIGFKK